MERTKTSIMAIMTTIVWQFVWSSETRCVKFVNLGFDHCANPIFEWLTTLVYCCEIVVDIFFLQKRILSSSLSLSSSSSSSSSLKLIFARWTNGLLPLALCSRNFQNVKLRLDFIEIWSFYRHSDCTWNRILVNSNGPKMSFLAILETLNLGFW